MCLVSSVLLTKAFSVLFGKKEEFEECESRHDRNDQLAHKETRRSYRLEKLGIGRRKLFMQVSTDEAI